MLSYGFLSFFAFLAVGFAIDLATPLSCSPMGQLPDTTSSPLAAASATLYGSMGRQGSIRAQASRCPRAKPTVTVVSTITSGGVSTVPTSPGFTAILSETYSVSLNPDRRRQLSTQGLDPTVVSLNPQGQITTSASKLPQSMICGPQTTPIPTLLAIPADCPAQSTITTTATTSVAASTTYEACASNNLVNQGFGKGTGHGINMLTFYNVTSNSDIDVATATDCCIACQMLGCAYGGFLANPPSPYCELYFQDHCDPTVWLGNTFTYNPDIVGQLPPDLGFTVFNGPCGQIVYGGASACKDYPCE